MHLSSHLSPNRNIFCRHSSASFLLLHFNYRFLILVVLYISGPPWRHHSSLIYRLEIRCSIQIDDANVEHHQVHSEERDSQESGRVAFTRDYGHMEASHYLLEHGLFVRVQFQEVRVLRGSRTKLGSRLLFRLNSLVVGADIRICGGLSRLFILGFFTRLLLPLSFSISTCGSSSCSFAAVGSGAMVLRSIVRICASMLIVCWNVIEVESTLVASFAFKLIGTWETHRGRDEVGYREHQVEDGVTDFLINLLTRAESSCEQGDIDENEDFLEAWVILKEKFSQWQVGLQAFVCLTSKLVELFEHDIKLLVLIVKLLTKVAKHEVRNRLICWLYLNWPIFILNTVALAIWNGKGILGWTGVREFESFISLLFILWSVPLRWIVVKVGVAQHAFRQWVLQKVTRF